MDFSFCILTTGGVDLNPIFDSIHALSIPHYEILVIGGPSIADERIIHIPFDETVRPNWITRKKNLLCQRAKYENIVLLHDYVEFKPDWYRGFLTYGNDFEFCVTRILNADGCRYRDYTVFPGGISPYFQQRALLPYDYVPPARAQKIMYISGTYYVLKKSLALRIPLDETRIWGQGEDVLFSKLVVGTGIQIKCNPNSTVQFRKGKVSASWEQVMTKADIETLESLSEETLETLNKRQRALV
jgi:hypothetical protein